MNDRELIYIRTIAETKSISKAAKKLFIAQPSLSQALQKIEEDIGTPLFNRNRDGIQLTYAGEKYYIMSKEILAIYNDFSNEVTYINDLKKGRITIGIGNFMGTYLLPKIIPKFIEKFPDLEVYIREEASSVLEQYLLEGSIDLAIIHNHPLTENKKISFDILSRDKFIIVTKIGHSISKYNLPKGEYSYPKINLNLLIDEKFILLEKNKRIREVTDIILNVAGINPNIALTLKNYETARRLASTGFGITLMPFNYIKIFESNYNADYYLIDDNKYAFWDTCIATNPNMYLSKAAREFIDGVHEYFNSNELHI